MDPPEPIPYIQMDTPEPISTPMQLLEESQIYFDGPLPGSPPGSPTSVPSVSSRKGTSQNDPWTSQNGSLEYQQECYVGERWVRFKSITGIRLNTEFETQLTLDWDNDSVDPNLVIPLRNLLHHYITKDWTQRFDNWSRTNNPVVGEVYTWSDLNVNVEIEPELTTWLEEKGLGQLTTIFRENHCVTKASLLHLTDDMLQRWGLEDVLRRYVLQSVQTSRR